MINEKEFTSKSLEELRADQAKNDERKHERRPMNERERAYWQRIRSESEQRYELSMEQALAGIQKTSRRADRKPICTPKQAKRLVFAALEEMANRYDFKLVVTDGMKEILPELCNYFTSNSSRLDSRKGIYLWGPVGCGKTTIIKAFQLVLLSMKASKLRFKINSCYEIYSEIIGSEKIDLGRFYSDDRCFDDIGYNPPQLKHFGNSVAPMEMILSHRYRKYQEQGQLTHCTSNLPFEKKGGLDLANRYDNRLKSRLHQMFNFVLLKGPDLRKN